VQKFILRINNLRLPPLDRYDWMAFSICVIAALVWVVILTDKFYNFGYYDWDLSIYSNLMWNLSRGSYFSSFFGMNVFANHAEYITFFLIPIYSLFPHPLTLLCLKILSFVMGAYVLYLLAKKSMPALYAVIFQFLYLTYPANIYGMLFEFHFETLNIVFLFLLFYFFQENKLRPFFITMFFLGIIKENMPLIVIMFGLLALFTKQSRKLAWTLGPIVFGVLLFYVSMFIITPSLRRDLWGPNQYLGAYSALGKTPVEILKTFLFHPGEVFNIILQPHNINYLKELFGPLGLITLFSPHILFLATPTFLQHLLSAHILQHTIFYHYTMTIVPFIFLATLSSLKMVQERIRPVFFHIVFLLIALSCLFNSSVYKADYLVQASMYLNKPETPLKWQMLNKIPPQAGVIATLDVDDHLSSRKEMYSFLNVARNTDGLNFRPFALPETVRFALIDLSENWVLSQLDIDPTGCSQRIRDFLSQGWVIRDAVTDVYLLERGEEKVSDSPIGMARAADILGVSREPFLTKDPKKEIMIDGQFRLLAHELGPNRFGHPKVFPMVFYWKAEQDIHADYSMVIILRNKDKTIQSEWRHVGSSIYPTVIWKQGDYIKEQFGFYLPQLVPGQYSLKMVFVRNEKFVDRNWEIVTQHPVPLTLPNSPESQKDTTQTGKVLNIIKVGEITIK